MNNKIIEGNKLIAEFDMLSMVEGGFYPIAGKLRIAEQLEYHSSWDWLMPVIEKINHIDKNANVTLRRDILHFQRNNNCIFDMTIFETKERVWYAVVDFIKWYNAIDKMTACLAPQ